VSSLRRFVPRPVRRLARRAFPASPPAPGLGNPPIEYPEDVADTDALRELLRDTDLFGASAVAEADDYIAHALERFRVTMALLPPIRAGARVLELGSNPYLLTRLLLARGLDVTCANWFGETPEAFGARGAQMVRGPRSGWVHEFEFDHFNVETDRFPYDDSSFDLVLCCEILEHLPTDPTRMLVEIHRVLTKPDGAVLVTTPNATRLENLLRMTSGRNVYEKLSGYGVYGRHNREYTVGELRDLLTAAGFAVEDAFARDLQPPLCDLGALAPLVTTAERGENLFALAHAVGDERWPYPEWLYQSRQAMRRIVRPDLVVGVNDDLQSAGFHEESEGPATRRWTGPGGVRVDLEPPAGAARLVIHGAAPPAGAGQGVRLSARWDEEERSWEIPCDGAAFVVEAQIAPLGAGLVEIHLETDRTWLPASGDGGAGDGGGEDRRRGVAIERVAIER